MEGYRVHIQDFDGPLDLLLHLIEKAEVNIEDIFVSEITSAYLSYMEDLTEEELDAVRKLYREAQWFFDFCYVENAEGAHNSELAFRCLDTSEKKIDEGMALLGK